MSLIVRKMLTLLLLYVSMLILTINGQVPEMAPCPEPETVENLDIDKVRTANLKKNYLLKKINIS